MKVLANYSSFTDEQLLKHVAESDVAAYEELYQRHWLPMYRFAWNLLKEAEAATDIVQDIFLWVWANRATLVITHTGAYLKAAVKFKVANYIRSGKIRADFFEASLHTPPDTPLTNEEILELRELKEIIAHAIAQLPEKCREIFLLSREQGMANRAIAEHLGISPKTVENQMTIALKKIRASLDSVSDGGTDGMTAAWVVCFCGSELLVHAAS